MKLLNLNQLYFDNNKIGYNVQNKANLISMISNCTDKTIKSKWILELANKSNIECSESECTGCLIEEDCLTTLSNIYPTPECYQCGSGLSGYNISCNTHCDVILDYK